MKGYLLFLGLTFGAYVLSVEGGSILAPPSDELAEDEARGLKGQFNPLASLQKSHAKCTVEGSYGIKNECSKYTECRKKGQIPTSMYCPAGKFFDHKKRLCVKSSDAQCKNVCPNDGDVFPDPTEPKGFLKCFKGVPMGHLCPDSQTFLADRMSCSAGGIPDNNSDED